MRFCLVEMTGDFAFGEYFRTLRLKSELLDLRVENAKSNCKAILNEFAVGKRRP